MPRARTAARIATIVLLIALEPMTSAVQAAAAPEAVGAPAAAVATSTTGPGVARTARLWLEIAEELRPSRYRLPVDGPVVRRFEAPTSDFGPGHRGIDLDAPSGTPVRAAERGRVHHAGAVAGVVWVSIDHADGVRTSYGPLVALTVSAGDEVARGAIIGVLAGGHHGEPATDRGLHLGARRDGAYLDPLGLPGLGAPRPTLVGPGGWWGAGHAVTPYDPWGGGRLGGLLTTPSPVAHAPGYASPPNANHLVLVAGLSSTSDVELIDPAHLGIGEDGFTRFSYAGADLPYGHEHTWQSVESAARRLEEQLREQARAQPGRAVDLLGHSLGGVVITHFLLHVHDPFDVGLPPIGHVVTIASPLDGSDLARAGVALVDAPWAGRVLRGAWELAGSAPGVVGDTARSLEPDAPSLHDIATGSPLLGDVAQAWREALLASGTGPLAAGTRVLNIVASLDGLVGADRAALEDAERRVLPGTHQGVLATEAMREVVWSFLAGREVVESPGRLATHLGAWYGTGLSAISVVAGDVGASDELPVAPFPVSETLEALRRW